MNKTQLATTGADHSPLWEQIEAQRSLIQNYFSSRVRTPEDAEDLVQEVYLRAYQSLGNFRGECPVEYWLMRIAVNLLKNYYRGLQSAPQTVSHSSTENEEEWVQEIGTEECQYLEIEERVHIERWIEIAKQVCTPQEFNVLWAYYRLDSMEEAAALMHMAVKTAWSHFRRGRARLIAFCIAEAPEMVGGRESIERAIQRASATGKTLSVKEQEAFKKPRYQEKVFREACLKIAPFLEPF